MKTRPKPVRKSANDKVRSPVVRIDARGEMLRAWSRAFRPRPRLSTIDWITSNVVLPPGMSPNPGRYSLIGREYLAGPLAAADDPDVAEIVLKWPTQVGKTTFLQALLQSRCDVCPAPIMLAGPDQDEVLKLRDDCYRMCGASPRLRNCIPPERLRNDRWIDFAGVRCYLAWAGNTQRLAGKSCQMVLATEIDKWAQSITEGSTQALVRNRVKAWFRYLMLWESTPTDEKSAIDALYQKSNKCQFYVPCPHCHHRQVLRFDVLTDGPYAGCGGIGGIRNNDGTYVTVDEAIVGAYYICERGCRIDNSLKSWMVAHGVWCPEGVTPVSTSSRKKEKRAKGGEAPGGAPPRFAKARAKTSRGGEALEGASPRFDEPTFKLVGEPVRSARVTGFHMTSLVSETISFGSFAAAWLEARDDEKLLQDFVNNWLAERWLKKAKIPKWDVLYRKSRAGHPGGSAPPQAFFLTSGCDVQLDRVYYVIRAWGEAASSWLVDYGCCHQKIGHDGAMLDNSDLVQLDELVINRIVALTAPNPVGWPTLMVRLTGIDCGFHTHRVWNFVRKRDRDRVRAVAGDSQMNNAFYQMTVVDRSARDGKKYEGGLERWGINTGTYKADIQHRWKQPSYEPGAWLLTGDSIERLEPYLRQVTNEGPIWKPNKHGRLMMSWEVLEPKLGNHYWDCEVYARACADMVTGGDWDNLAGRCQANVPRRAAGAAENEGFSARD